MDIKDFLIHWVENNSILKRDEISGNLNQNFLEQGWFDSFSFMALISEIEDRFKIQFSENDFNNRNFCTLNGLAELVQHKNNKDNELVAIDLGRFRSEVKDAFKMYFTEGQIITNRDIKHTIKELGVQAGDIIFVHSNIQAFGRFANQNHADVLETTVNILKESVGSEGTIIMPAFTYSFCNNEVFDIHQSKSTVGVLTEYFRNLPDVKRTIQPIYSVCIWGKERFEKASNDCFGEDSIFQWFHKKNGKILVLGAPFQSITFVHYVEQYTGVPYRYFKTFSGIIKDGSTEQKAQSRFYVRMREKNVKYDMNRFEKWLTEKNLLRKIRVGYGDISVISAEDYFTGALGFLRQVPYGFLKETPQI